MNKESIDLKKVAFLEFYVGNHVHSKRFFEEVLGFKAIAYCGLETGNKEKASYVMQQGEAFFILSSSLKSTSRISQFIEKHGEGVGVVAFEVENIPHVHNLTVQRGATSFALPEEITTTEGVVEKAAICSYGDVVHELIDRSKYTGDFLPEYHKIEHQTEVTSIGIKRIDHLVGNVEKGKMDVWTKFYADVLGFTQLVSFDDKDISTKYTSLMSKVMMSDNEVVKFPINEPADGLKKSQIDEYLEFNNGAGVQHIALETDDIVQTISKMTKSGMNFLYVPETYYENIEDRIGEIDEDIEKLKSLGVLVDRDEDGYLLQLFTKPIVSRPTLFIEIIQRKGAKSFGKGNFKALFESIEREQEKRGTL